MVLRKTLNSDKKIPALSFFLPLQVIQQTLRMLESVEQLSPKVLSKS